MGLFLHLRDKVFRVKDQAVLPVPLDPDLLWLAQQAKSQNVVQDIYRMQMERNQSRPQYGFGDFDESKVKRDEGGKFSTTGGGGAKSQEPKRGEFTVYHATRPQFIGSIKQDGLLIRAPVRNFGDGLYKGERGESIYVNSNIREASQWAAFINSRGKRFKGIILEVHIPEGEGQLK